ncbi:hypothetical protein PoB_001615400 [Plakobranchus ocellatus]|uniref:Uncharacterized protein n=1 Tax=Plakobranchus ocellatus TaxID=259542 RepID=A0AAV3Z6N1_9GAST|nr:hypothetical protein PoB_001615400 [Plakobranchus ocellatus]
MFQQAAVAIQVALSGSGYKEQLHYMPSHKFRTHADAARDNTNPNANKDKGETIDIFTNQGTHNNNKANNTRIKSTSGTIHHNL